jgi:phosphate transport system permease protein
MKASVEDRPPPSGGKATQLPSFSQPGGARLAGVGDAVFRLLCQAAAALVVGLAVLLVIILVWRAWESIWTNGVAFFTNWTWDPEPTHRAFGSLAFIYGTVVTSAIAMLIAVPLGVGTATYLAEIAPHWLRRVGAFLVEMLAAIPSVVYGFWGLYVMAPALQTLVSQLGGPNQAGKGILPAGVILSIMVVPYVAAVSFDVIRAVPRSQREGALALGATRWQTLWTAVLPYARPGIIGGSFLALGRALGETMAVTMLIGNRTQISFDLFAKGNSIPSVIANEFTEATYDLYLSSLVELGLVLLLVSVGFSAIGRLLTWSVSRQARPGKPLFGGLLAFRKRPSTGFGPPADPAKVDSAAPRSTPELAPPSRSHLPDNKRSAMWMNQLMTGGDGRYAKLGYFLLILLVGIWLATAFLVQDATLRTELLALVAAVALVVVVSTLGVLGACLAVTTVPLFLILGYLLYRGGTSLNWDFFTKLPKPVGETGGGMANAFYGSFLMVGLATAFSVPVGLLAAIYLTEYRSGWFGQTVRFVGEMLGSVPSIVIGIFGYYAVVRPITGQFSGLAGGFALGVMMIPIIMRTSEELKLVPATLRNASYALGASQWQTVLRVTVPAALPAIITAIFLGIARVAGETAPLLLTASGNAFWPRSLNDLTPSLPVYIFNYAVSADENWHRQAWAAAFVLLVVIMVLNVGVRLLAGKRVLQASQAD